MRPKVTPNVNILGVINYNEQKVTHGKAERIGSENFLKDFDQLTKKDIIDRFRQRTSLNELFHDDGFHISLNFGKKEVIGKERLVQIADRFMAGMGMGDQPYVTYQHHDAGHTHTHIVATAARADGTRIHFDPPGLHRSHILCRQLEKEFTLEPSRHVSKDDEPQFTVNHALKVVYGEPGLKRSISDVLNTVFDHYRYTSLDEYNAILKQYNVTANPGLEGSYLHRVGGLLYHALDEGGNRIGVPIKASLFLLKPTLKNLVQRFEHNQSLRESSRERVSMAIDWALTGREPDWESFRKDLEKKGIAVVTGKGIDGKEQLFFVDHIEKSGFSASGLGSDYSFESLRNKCIPEEHPRQGQIITEQLRLKL
jgi:relaxase-like protein